MNGETFYSYMTKDFFPWAKQKGIEFPIIVFLDGHSSHLSLPLCEFCQMNEIILIALLPNSTHILQPMDIGIIKPFKVAWAKHRAFWNGNNRGKNFSREDFIELLGICTNEISKRKELFLNAFRACGI